MCQNLDTKHQPCSPTFSHFPKPKREVNINPKNLSEAKLPSEKKKAEVPKVLLNLAKQKRNKFKLHWTGNFRFRWVLQFQFNVNSDKT